MIGRAEDESRLSTDPQQIRRRLRRHSKNNPELFKKDLEHYGRATGFKPVHEWDLDELSHGKPRNPDGSFKGPAPKWISAEVTREVKKRLHGHVFSRLTKNADMAVKTIVRLMNSQEVDDKGKPIVDARTQLAAAQFIIEHVIGKPTTQLEIDATDNVRQMFANAIVLDDGREDSHLIVEGEVVADPDLVEDED